MIIGPLSGSLGDRLGRLRIAGSALVVSVLGISGMLLTTGTVPVFASVIFLAVGVRSYPPAMQAFAMERFPGDSLAGDFGALKTMYSGIGSLGPLYIGTVGEFANYNLAYVGLVAALVVGIGITATLQSD